MKDEREYTPEFSRPEQSQAADPNADQAAYFAYWTLKHQMEKQEREQSSGIYEDIWQRYYSASDD
jgi:hypothetical protein